MSNSLNNECERKLLKVHDIIGENEKEELRDKIIKLNNELHEKIAENEKYQQELYEVKHQLKASRATQKDLADAVETLEENLNVQQEATEKKVNNLLERIAADKKIYEEKITEVQTSLACEEKKNEELRDAINAKEKLLAIAKIEGPDKTEENFMLKDKIKDLIKTLEEKEIYEHEILSNQQQLEETISTLQKNYNEVNDILQVKKIDLQSLNEILETTRDELVMCRAELQSLKATPASDSIKGNSLFAEVEDNRQKLINDISSMKKKYLHMKQTYGAKDNEIRALKVERAALLRKWDEDTSETVDHSATLIETYKSRITELESKIKMGEKNQKIKDANKEPPTENNFSYLQSLLTAKKKEVEELYNKLEESSTQKILQEEMKYEVEKQLRRWKCKAMSYQAQILTAQNQTKCEECLKIKPKDTGDGDLAIDKEKLNRQSTTISTSDLKLTNNFDTTFQKLLQVPTIVLTNKEETISDCSLEIDLDKSGQNISTIELEKTVYMDETMPIYSGPSSARKSISYHESNKENSQSTSNDNNTILRSVLVKSEDNVQEKCKKSLRFATDTIDHEKPKLVRQKIEKKEYPVIFISNQSSK